MDLNKYPTWTEYAVQSPNESHAHGLCGWGKPHESTAEKVVWECFGWQGRESS